MLDRLEAGDAAAELLALADVGEGQVEGALGGAGLLAGESDGGDLQDLVEQGFASVVGVQAVPGGDRHLVQLDARAAAGLVEGRQRLAEDAGLVGGHGEQAHFAGVVAGRDDQQVGAGAVEHCFIYTVEAPAVAVTRGAWLFGGVPAVAALAEGEGGGEAAGGQFRQPVLAQRLVVAQQQRRGGQAGAGEERRAEQVVTHLFEQDHLLDEAQAHAAVLLGNHQPRPAQLLGDLPPQLSVEALRAGHGGAHGRRIGGGGEKARRALLDHQLFVTQREVH
ncbi:hypothetical protein D9M71_348430 [compost metagenome]